VHGGRLRDRKGLNLPGVEMSAPGLTEKDLDDARYALDIGADWLALSFVRQAAEVDELRSVLPPDRRIGIIAKIEHPDALDDIDAILSAADAIMVARGDLGVELPPERVPVIQRDLVARARKMSKPSIIATQMLESMIEHPRPTRAEVSDVSTSVFSGADAVMLSAETATGRHATLAVKMMDRIARQIEAHLWTESGFMIDSAVVRRLIPVHEAVARSTAQLSRDLGIRSIVALSGSGSTARIISSARPAAPIVAPVTSAHMARQLAMLWGTIPQLVTEAEMEDPHEVARRLVRELGLAEPGQLILTVGGFGDTPDTDVPAISVLRV
jgi:pyruvate kinase